MAFLGGLASIYAALASPLDAFSGLRLQVHMLQHWLLMMLAPPLLLLGAPLAPLLRGLPRGIRRDALGPFLASPALQHTARRLVHPVICWLALAVTTWLWHLPAAYELALRSEAWHEIEHACFFGAALLFWWPVVLPWPARAVWPRAAMIPYLVLADLQNTAFSALFAFSDRVLYPSYAVAPQLADHLALSDQASAGALMWVLGGIAFLLPIGWIVREMLEPAALQQTARRRALPRPSSARQACDLLRPLRGRAWPASPGFRRAARAVTFALAAAVITDGLLGPQMSPMNLAGVMPWIWWRGLVVLGLFAAGNLFCFACPFMGVRDLARRWLPAPPLRWPRALRSKWLAAVVLGTLLAASEGLALWDDPRGSAWLVCGYFVAALAVDSVFRGASFCKYVCPIGQFQFLGSTLSPREVRPRAMAVCRACRTRDCIRGSETQRGCELGLFAPAKVGNLDCTFCLDCVRACPHDNLGLLPAVPARELADPAPRSSLGRLGRRPDLAALAGVVVAGAFVTAAAMVTPVAEKTDALAAWLGSRPAAQALLFAAGLVLAPTLALTLCGRAARALGRSQRSARELATRFSLALVPLGFGMWAAHFAFHLVTAYASVVPVLQRLAGDLGLGAAGAPDWRMAHGGGSSGLLLGLEILLLDLGLLLTLHTGWRVSQQAAPAGHRAAATLAPFALLASALWLLGLWILVQPMEMRGTMRHG